MKIVKYRTLKDKSARRGHPAIIVGTILYLIQYNDKSYFNYGYVLESSSKKVASRLTGGSLERNYNSTKNPEDVLQTWVELS